MRDIGAGFLGDCIVYHFLCRAVSAGLKSKFLTREKGLRLVNYRILSMMF